MKIYLDGVLVVEGKEDVSYLSNYIASEIVPTNGFDVTSSLTTYLKDKKAIILTDPDEAGQKIREKLNKLLPNAVNVEIDAKYCIRGSKNGVAECDINEILTKLKRFSTTKDNNKTTIKSSDLYNLGLINNKDLRNKVCDTLNFGRCNAKTFYKRLLNNNVSLDQLYEIIKSTIWK